MDLQSLINSNGADDELELPPGEFFGQVTVHHPITISGKGKASWIGARKSPVIRIASPGVTLKDVMIEVTTGHGDVAIEADEGTNPILENVAVRGVIVGVPPENIADRVPDTQATSKSITFLPPPPIGFGTLDETPLAPSRTTPLHHSVPALVVPPRGTWWKFAAASAAVLIVVLAIFLYASSQASREKANTVERVNEAKRIADMEKDQLERVKREKEQEIERHRTIALQDRDREITQQIKGGQATRVRENIRHQVEHISRVLAESRHKMQGDYRAIMGDLQKGNSGWAIRSSTAKAFTAAMEACEKNGGPCEAVFSICVENTTAKTITIFLYHPWESHFTESNSLWSWDWKPGEVLILSLRDEVHLLLSKRFYLSAKCADGTKWGPKRIEEYNYALMTYSDEDALKITFPDSPIDEPRQQDSPIDEPRRYGNNKLFHRVGTSLKTGCQEGYRTMSVVLALAIGNRIPSLQNYWTKDEASILVRRGCQSDRF